MTKYYSVNKQYASGDGASCIYDLVNTLVSASWTIQSSSNGTNFDAGATYWTPTSLANSNAWVTVREPTGPGGREWCFQRTTNNYTWRIKISPYIGFTGSATATQVPTASDEGLIWGSGTDASPTGTALFVTQITKFHIVAESTPVGPVGNQAYGFWAFQNLNGAFSDNYQYALIAQEPLAVGSYPALTGSRAVTVSGDADPCVYACYGNASGYTFSIYFHGYNDSANTSTFSYFHKYQNASGSFVQAFDIGGTGGPSYYIYPRYVGVHPCSGEDVNFPFMLGRYAIGTSGYLATVTTNIGFKGICNSLKIKGVNRSTGTVCNLSTNAFIYVVDMVMPWPENVVPEL